MRERETVGQFAARVKTLTGVDMNSMPVRRIHRGVGGTMGHIMAKCENVYVCATGYPSHVDDDNTEFFTTFEVVVIG